MLLRITKLSLQLFNRAYRRLCLLMLWKGGGKKSYLACIRLNTYIYIYIHHALALW